MKIAPQPLSLALLPRPPWPSYPHSHPLHHVVYEFDMLWFTHGWLLNLNGRPPSAAIQLIKNAALESFAVHVRGLIEFIYRCDNARRDDIKARELVDYSGAWERDRDQVPFAWKPVWDRANMRIARHRGQSVTLPIGPLDVPSAAMEQSENIGPKYAIRIRDLRHWHIITAECLQCRHKTEFTGEFLAWERSPHAHLADLQRKLRCARCGNREGNTLSVRMAARE